VSQVRGPSPPVASRRPPNHRPHRYLASNGRGILGGDIDIGGRTKRMNIYFSCSLTGGRADEAIYGHIVEHLLAGGHEVPTAHLAKSEVMDLERVVDPADVYARDVAWIDGCDALIAEVSTPSHGVGYEIALALARAKPVLCCYRTGRPVSKMITGNDSAGLQVRDYQTEAHALTIVDRFLDSLA
jgi:hypothetical protein